ncbi:Low-specificity L-threonine aldolase, partial [hydrothermal vent metagenome]
HISADECGAPELFTGGAKLIGLDGVAGKITPKMVEGAIAGFISGEHDPKPAAISITQSSELGTVYSLDEVQAFGNLARDKNLKLHMDGARFANALVALGCSPADVTWKAGVDALSFGATKNGAMNVEAVVFFDLALAVDFEYRRMRAGQLLSKNRFLAAQMEAYLTDDLWLDNARHANEMAARLADGLGKTQGVRFGVERQANEVFLIVPKAKHNVLAASDAVFHQWQASGSDTAEVGDDEVMIRLVTSFATSAEDVDEFVTLMG